MELTEKTEGCQCEFCLWSHKFDQHIKNVPEESKGFFNEMADMLVSIQEEHSYAEAVINGSWPSADEVIAFRRKKLTEKKVQKLKMNADIVDKIKELSNG